MSGYAEAVVEGRNEFGRGRGIFHCLGNGFAGFTGAVGSQCTKIFFEVEEQGIGVAVEPLHPGHDGFIQRSGIFHDGSRQSREAWHGCRVDDADGGGAVIVRLVVAVVEIVCSEAGNVGVPAKKFI